ncbi:Cof-type HAD-IIB family hydrolase [Aureibacillus halotolerans]|nr:Cof-type HAD-IIB family hydrolase [Aureibacillus halotolerans]
MANGRFSGILLVSDMDGTLLSTTKTISTENKDAIRYFTENGGTFTLATGRIPRSAGQYIADLAINAPGVFYNGGMIYDLHKQSVVFEQALSPEAEATATAYINAYPTCGAEVYSQGVLHIVRSHPLIEKHLTVEAFISKRVNSFADVPHPWQKVIFVDDSKQIDEMEKNAPEADDVGHYVRSDEMFFELLPPNVSKGRALKKLAAMLDIPMNRVAAVGDNMNDEDMLKTAGAGFAVSNACDAIRQCAPYGCCANDDHAIVEVVKWIETNWAPSVATNA